MNHPTIPAALAALALGLGAAGCGEDGEAAGTDTATTTTATTPAEVPEGVAAQYQQIEEEVEAEGGETQVGPWRIAYIVEPAEGWFEPRGGQLRWRPPAAGETHHIEILPIEADTGRLVPDVPITLEVIDGSGRRVARERLRFYYAEFFHYAENLSIPEAGDYTLRATIAPPPFPRHGEEEEGPALPEGASAEFEGVHLEPELE
ncbi:MAG: iron transporter [Thermoleophilaceae bacterium]